MNDRVEPEKCGWNVDAKARPSTLSKSDIRYWQARCRKTGRNPFYSVPMQHAGRRMELSLQTANIFEAGKRAKEYYLFLINSGWDAFLEKYRPESETAQKSFLTVGRYIELVRERSDLPDETIAQYSSSFRRIISGIFGLKATNKTCDVRTGTHAKWIEKLHSIPLGLVTPERVRKWKKEFVDQAGTNVALRRQKGRTASSYLKRAKALFGRNVLPHLEGIELPNPLPFAGVQIERVTSKFYGVPVTAEELLRQGMDELAFQEPEAFKLLILGLCFGLRRAESDMLEWPSIDFAGATLRVMPTAYFRPKTKESMEPLPIEQPILELLQGWKARSASQFVVDSPRRPKSVTYQWYRCTAWPILLQWLKDKGLKGEQKVYHLLRKMHGAALADQHGIFAAASGLRHVDVRVTAEYYADSRARFTTGFGNVFSVPAKVIPLPKPALPAADHPAAGA